MLKQFLYEWNGLNQKILIAINSAFGKKEYDNIMILADITGGHHNFHYHLFAMILIAVMTLFYYRKDRDMIKNTAVNWLELFSTLLMSLFFTYAIIFQLKNAFSIARPFCTASLNGIHSIPYIIGPVPCNHSFPSGHMAFVAVFVTALWPYLNRYTKIFSTFLIIFIGISRMAAGAHFPADLVWSLIICIPTTIFVRFINRYILERYYKFYEPVLEKVASMVAKF